MKISIQSFNQLIKTINESAGPIQRDRGTYFEQLVQIYLQNEPIYKKINNIKTDLSKFCQVSFFNYLGDSWGTRNPISSDFKLIYCNL